MGENLLLIRLYFLVSPQVLQTSFQPRFSLALYRSWMMKSGAISYSTVQSQHRPIDVDESGVTSSVAQPVGESAEHESGRRGKSWWLVALLLYSAKDGTAGIIVDRFSIALNLEELSEGRKHRKHRSSGCIVTPSLVQCSTVQCSTVPHRRCRSNSVLAATDGAMDEVLTGPEVSVVGDGSLDRQGTRVVPRPFPRTFQFTVQHLLSLASFPSLGDHMDCTGDCTVNLCIGVGDISIAPRFSPVWAWVDVVY